MLLCKYLFTQKCFLPQDLKPETEYRVDLYIIPVHGTAKELVSEKAVTFRTLPPVQGKTKLPLP